MANRIYVTNNDKIVAEENNLVTLILADGTEYKSLEPRRLFPVSSLDTYITMLDEEGTEIALIKNLADLDRDSKKVVNNSLDDYYLVPKILRILHTEEKYGTLRWTVETERGEKKFDIRNRNHDIKVFKDGRVRVRDSDDNRYVIDNYNALDAHSKARLMTDL